MAAHPEHPVRFVFRFRDLVAHTLEEHRKIINRFGSCWWGWWKRPSEDNREDVWSQLAREASDETPISIALFDSGHGEVYRALVTAVIPPTANPKSPAAQPRIPEGQEERIPEYYRASPFSRAWMKLTKVNDSPMEFFGNYSFAAIPRLPNYSSSVLSRFIGKVVVEPDELRGMDTTIWEVRPRQAGDHEERILLTTPALPSAVAYQPILATSAKILHLTDLHFASGDHRTQHVWRLEGEENRSGPTLVEAISTAVHTESIGLVIVTGDLTFKGVSDEYQHAAVSLVRLLGVLNLSTDHLIVIPGNHDIKWTREDKDKYDDISPVNQAPDAAKANYAEFYQRLFRHDPNENLSMGRRFLLPSGVVLEVCALNSSSLETGKNFLAGMGRIQEAAFADVANGIRWSDNSTMALRLLAIHHHLALTEDLEPAGGYYRGFGIAVDAARVQRMAAKRGVQLALHGHKHRAFIWRSSVYELPEQTQPGHRLGSLSIVGGGSVGSKETDAASNFFNLFDVTADGLELAIYRARNAGIFEKILTWRARLTIGENPKRLILEDWEEGKKNA